MYKCILLVYFHHEYQIGNVYLGILLVCVYSHSSKVQILSKDSFQTWNDFCNVFIFVHFRHILVAECAFWQFHYHAVVEWARNVANVVVVVFFHKGILCTTLLYLVWSMMRDVLWIKATTTAFAHGKGL